MHLFVFVLFAIATVIFAMTALGATVRSWNLMAAGLFFLSLALAVQAYQRI